MQHPTPDSARRLPRRKRRARATYMLARLAGILCLADLLLLALWR